jgi:hypothetical protein
VSELGKGFLPGFGMKIDRVDESSVDIENDARGRALVMKQETRRAQARFQRCFLPAS